MSTKKLIYILNSYSINESSHFEHIFHLLETIANKDIEICLIIEKPQHLPSINNENIEVIGLKHSNPLLRQMELFRLVSKLIKNNYKKTFIRISSWATITASLAHKMNDGETFLWQSGTTHEVDWFKPMSAKKLKWILSSYIPNWSARKLTTWFVTGPELMVDYYANVVNIPRKKIKLLYNDINLERFNNYRCDKEKSNFLKENNLKQDAKILLLVHRLSPVRKTLMYLEPFMKKISSDNYKDWIVVIAGGGSELVDAKSLAKKLNVEDRFIFLGNVPNNIIPRLYSIADVFFIPTYTEGFPRVLIEAMASGLPIVSTDAGGSIQIVGPQQKNYITPKNNPNTFADTTLDLLDNPSQWKSLIDENLEYVKNFSTEKIADMYIREIFHGN